MMKRNLSALLSLTVILGLTKLVSADDAIPTEEKFAHYEPMLKRSPFAVATASAPASAPDFAKDLYVANAAHFDDGDYVTIASTTNKDLKEYLNTKEVIHGYSISNIQWSDRVGETKVTISKDGQFATLTFNEALLSQAIQNPAPAIPAPQQPVRAPGMPNVPGLPGVPNNNIPQTNRPAVQRPMPVPRIPTPPPHTRPVIRRKGAPAQNFQQPQQPQQPISPDDDFGTP